jgi:hypothetical protein
VRLRLAFQYFGWKIRACTPTAPSPPTERSHPLTVVMPAANTMLLQLTDSQPQAVSSSPSTSDVALLLLHSRVFVTLPSLAWLHIA